MMIIVGIYWIIMFNFISMSCTLGLGFLREIERKYQKQRKIKIDVSKTQYPLIRNVASNEMGWTVWGKEDQKGDANLFWVDTYITEEAIKRLNPYQRINHFPNSQQLCKKNSLFDNLKKLSTIAPDLYNFFPKTWILPEETSHLAQSHKKSKKWYIVKPASSSQGKGIYLTKEINLIQKDQFIVQEYISNPFLIDRCKFDLRIYVLIKSLNPLKVFRYVQGLTRISINQYEKPDKSNKNNLLTHLTNYAINRVHPAYIKNKSIEEDWVGHKRSLSATFQYLEKQGCDKTRLLSEIDEIIMKSILAAYPKMNEAYKNCRNCEDEVQSVCFQILGFDILLDEQFKPWLLQINHSPSFCTDTPLDHIIKKSLILDSMLLLNMHCEDKQFFLKNKGKEMHVRQKCQKDLTKKRHIQDRQYQKQHLGGFVQIYPSEKQIYQEIKKILEKEKIKKKKKILNISVEKVEKNEKEENIRTADTSIKSPVRKSNQLMTYYNGFTIKHVRERTFLDSEKPKQEDAIKRHLFEREKKRIQPIKLNNVNISFKQQKQSKNYSRSSQGNRWENNSFSMSKTCYFEQPKTSDSFRKQINLLDGQIRSRIGKIKMARIKLQKIKSQERNKDFGQCNDYPSSRKVVGKSYNNKNLKPNIFLPTKAGQILSKYA